MAASSNISGYEDVMLWRKEEKKDVNNDTSVERVGVFPIGRYDNILQRPRMLPENTSLMDTPNLNFALVATETEEISDDVVYELFGQIW